MVEPDSWHEREEQSRPTNRDGAMTQRCSQDLDPMQDVCALVQFISAQFKSIRISFIVEQ